MWASDSACRALGMGIVDVGPGRATLDDDRSRDDMTNGHGMCHGGFIFTLADSAFAFACNTYNQNAVAQHCSVTFIRAGQARRPLTADAVERSRSGRSGIYDITVTGGDGKVIAEFRGHSRMIEGNWCRRAVAHRARTADGAQPARCTTRASHRPTEDTMLDLTPPRESLEPIEIASRDEIAALQLQRLQVDAAARLRQRAALPEERSTPPACTRTTCKSLDDLAKFPFTTKAGPARTTIRSACSPCRRTDRARARLLRHHRQADRRRLHQGATSTPGRT